ncbi:MAG: class I SAM-dependent methyltransferase [Acidobacteria bacterium]|nr:class I SAM-dependent methyltransferase [Acidobacteriota bacterium]MCA1632209.1 class I SAM-dependent methyltransferase [Acidobacteriota bacterium]MCA1640389.1 class I SAM-dependent methyltransferase [Acidobacteriota bacterium]
MTNQPSAEPHAPSEPWAHGGVRLEAVRDCPLCGGGGRRLVFDRVRDCLDPSREQTFRYVQCEACALVYQDPMVIAADLPECYDGYHTHETETLPASFTGEWGGATKWIRGGVLAHKYGYEHLAPASGALTLAARALDLLPAIRSRARCGLGGGAGGGLPRFSGEGKALDIGTGNGVFAATLARLGWDVTGVEFDEVAARNAAECHGLRVLVSTLEDARFEDGSFDFVSMFHVIEHLPDPVATLREVRRVLRAGGRLMLRTPNFDSLTRRAAGRYWRGVEAPRHLYLFNRRSLTRALGEAGLRVVAAATTRGGTRYYVEESLRFRAAEMGETYSPRAAAARAKFQNVLIRAARPAGLLLGDELHVEAVR